MLRFPDQVRAFEDALARATGIDEESNRAAFDAFVRQACALGVLPPENRLEGIEVDVRLARVLHAAGTPR